MLGHSVFSQHFNQLLQRRYMWKKNITLNVRFLSGQHRFTIKGFTRDISDIYVGTLNILYSFGYQKTMRHIDGILCEILHNYGSLLPHIIIHQWRINRLHYMLDRLVFFLKITIDCYKWVRGGRNIQHTMLAFHGKNTASKSHILQQIMTKFMLALLKNI